VLALRFRHHVGRTGESPHAKAGALQVVRYQAGDVGVVFNRKDKALHRSL
jgi:hypothetical protein